MGKIDFEEFAQITCKASVSFCCFFLLFSFLLLFFVVGSALLLKRCRLVRSDFSSNAIPAELHCFFLVCCWLPQQLPPDHAGKNKA